MDQLNSVAATPTEHPYSSLVQTHTNQLKGIKDILHSTKNTIKNGNIKQAKKDTLVMSKAIKDMVSELKSASTFAQKKEPKLEQSCKEKAITKIDEIEQQINMIVEIVP